MDSDSHVPAYKHKPLPSARSIRVLKLLPSAQRSAPIRCEIEFVDLDSTQTTGVTGSRRARAQPLALPYEALSYVWGAPVGTIPILCHGRRLFVTPNCHDALIVLRRKTRTRVLWIDAICIDQTEEGLEERNEQVKLMGEVYRRSHRVVVWLGQPQSKGIARVFSRIACIGRLAEITDRRRYLRPVGELLNKHLSAPFIWDSHKNYSKYVEFLNNPWIFRIWTTQEVAFGRTIIVMCGESSISWRQLQLGLAQPMPVGGDVHYAHTTLHSKDRAKMLIDFWTPGAFSDEHVEHDDNVVLTSYPDYRDWELEMLSSIPRHIATLPHDKVYGIYSLLAFMRFDLPTPDYSRPAEDVMAETTKCWIRKRKSLTVIYLATRPDWKLSTYPSWTPGWAENAQPAEAHLDESGHAHFTHELLDAEYYRASGGTTAHLFPPLEGDDTDSSVRRLGVRGKCVGLVTRCCSSSVAGGAGEHHEPEFLGTFTNACRQWCGWVAGLESYPTGESPLTAFSHTATFPRFRWTSQADHFRTDFEHLFDVMLYPNCKRIDPRSIEANADPDASNVVLGYIMYIWSLDESDPLCRLRDVYSRMVDLSNYVFFLVDSGHMGVAYHVMAGDELWLLAGSHCPVVLRRSDDERQKRHYRFVAPAYVHGIMEGEAWPDDETLLEDIVLV